MDAFFKRTRRLHSPEFKQQLVNACREPGASVAGVAPAHVVNADLVRRWLREQGVIPSSRRPAAESEALGLMPVRVDPPQAPPNDIRIERKRSGKTHCSPSG